MTPRKRRTLSTAMLALALTAAGLVSLTPSPTRAAVTTTGSINSSGTNYIVGYTADGTLQIDNGSTLGNSSVTIGYNTGVTGKATVTGTDSTWTNNLLAIGRSGNGELVIQNSGQLDYFSATLGLSTGSSGKLIVMGSGSKMFSSTGGGNLKIGASGDSQMIVADGGSVNSSVSFLGILSHNARVIVTDPGSIWTNTGPLDVGGISNITVKNGAHVINGVLYFDSVPGQRSTLTVTGHGSAWNNDSSLEIGTDNSGGGTLAVLDGGLMTGLIAYLGENAGTSGYATISGRDSQLKLAWSLYVGYSGYGNMSVADSGLVSARAASINSQSQATFHVSGNDMMVLGDATTTGTVTNNGVINFYADPFLTAGTYTPISEYAGRAMTWSGTGTYNAWGGTWDGTNHTFTVSAPTALGAGVVDSVSTGERLLITDAASGHHVGASFGTVTGGTTFAATEMTSNELDALAAALASTGGAGDVLAGWDFTTNFTGGTVMLSFDLGLGMSDLQVWHYSGGAWSLVTPDLLTYDSHGILSFTVDAFSGYGVTGVAPEPASLVLLTLGTMGLVRRRR